jgi:hypothetical protein
MRTSSKVVVGAVLAGSVALGLTLLSRPKTVELSPPEPVKPTAPILALPPPPPPPVVVDAAPLPPPAAKKPAKRKLMTETELLDKLRRAQDTDDYMLSYELAREGQRRFPDSPNAPEIAAMVVKSLARQGKISEARAEAEEMVNKYAGTHWAREVERHTGAHPHVNQVPPP